MKCAPILILLITTFIIIISFLYLETSYFKPTRLEESFTNSTISQQLYKTSPDNYLTSLSNRSESNLIGNGNFDNKQDIDGHFGSSYGNEIISFPNPGKGPYVLKQMVKSAPVVSYKISTRVNGGQYYKLSSWLHNNLDNKIDEVYKLVVHLRNDKSISYTPEITSVQTATIEGNLWIQNDIIFQIPHESNGKLDISLETNSHITSGINYITDIWLEKYHPLLNGVPSHNKLAFFLSSNQAKLTSQGNSNQTENYSSNGNSSGDNNHSDTNSTSTKLWKDISNNAKDFVFTNNTSYTGNAFNLTNNTIIGPPCSELGVKVDDFTIGWYLSCKPISGKKVFMKLFTSADRCSTMEISYLSNHPNYCSLQVDFLDKLTKWDIGYINNQNVYVLTYKNGNFNLTKDGIALTAYVKNKSDMVSSEEINPDRS